LCIPSFSYILLFKYISVGWIYTTKTISCLQSLFLYKSGLQKLQHLISFLVLNSPLPGRYSSSYVIQKKNPNLAISVAKRDWNSKKRCIKNTTMLAYVLTFKYMHASPQKKRGKTEIPQIHHRDARYIQTRVPKKKTINFWC